MSQTLNLTVLITGATGHVGFNVLLEALRTGYNVRATVRCETKATALRSHPLVRSACHHPSQLSTLIVPDITAPRAFDQGVDGADFIIHIASALPNTSAVSQSQYDAHFVRPAVYSTIGVLEAAARTPSVRRVVITSSIVALIPLAQLEGREAPTPVSSDARVSFSSAPYADEFAAYAASKVAALAVAERWVQRRRPRFDVTHIHPSFVHGRKDFMTSKHDMFKGTNTIVLGVSLGKAFGSFIGASVHNDDVAKVHIQALDPSVPGNTSYIVSQPSRWDAVKEIAPIFFPEAVRSGKLPLTGSASTIDIDIDTSKTEEVFNIDFRNPEDQVKDILSFYLETQRPSSILSRTAPPMDSLRKPVQVLT
ncbi:NAD dependent epimerase/dehydratase [Polyplosphaeria fusca]|uniref:NAD dependent epimerase/dehydratase n=1 Tax=Polyplosphaeria fusca TaxID=682080 RepID=A0A9P4R1N5_9PLEO|nr:NAD dependent epimerase/dehydratase [Polyplosphaeria fusca]